MVRFPFAIPLILIAGFYSICADAKPVRQVETNVWGEFGHARNWSVDWAIGTKPHLRLNWEQEVGEGQSQIVGDNDRIYVASGKRIESEKGTPRNIETVLSARSTKTGEPIWDYRLESKMSEDQQTFGGNKPTPQATPLLLGGRILLMTFTGQLHCLNAEDGKMEWSKDLQTEFKAQAVQFGFSSSVVASPTVAGQLVILAAGEKGGLINLSLKEGKINWVAPVASFSYATPVLAEINGHKQWLVVSRKHVLGVDDQEGKTLWKFDLREQGLTNVPSPLVVKEGRILISGQGCKGTQCIEIGKQNKGWSARELWYNPRLQFFYTNWLMLSDTIALGCTEQYMTAVDCSNGKQLGRWRGFGDGNILKIGNRYMALNGKGDLSVLMFENENDQGENEKFVLERKYVIGQGRFWTVPSAIGDCIFVRFGDMLQSLSFHSEPSENDLPNRIASDARKELELQPATRIEPDPVQLIFETFDTDGQEAALQLYGRFRGEQRLSAEQRIELAEAAYAQGLKDLAILIMQHGIKDFPNSQTIKEKISEWRGK